MEALHAVVQAGKVRYLGASSMYAWQFSKAQYIAERNGWTKFTAMQNHYNLIQREEEREMLPLCLDQGVGVIPWSPLARGKLARPWESEATTRADNDAFGKSLYGNAVEADKAVVARVGHIAAERGVPMAQVALAWVAGNPAITAPIVGFTKPHHLDDAVAGLELTLTAEEVASLEEPYVPHPIAGF
jgi:aryl-alcohol dehydrogenase (NADP+)